MRRPALLLGLLVAGLAAPVWAGLSLSTDNRSLFFGVMQLGETKELAQFGSSHNSITCSSTNNRAWYLKVQVLQPLSAGGRMIPLEQFQWQLVSTTGVGTLAWPYQYVPLTPSPMLVYTSGANEASGTAVTLRFKYSLTIPETQASGIYQTTIRFTLAELL